jgi:hypothetical protein
MLLRLCFSLADEAQVLEAIGDQQRTKRSKFCGLNGPVFTIMSIFCGLNGPVFTIISIFCGLNGPVVNFRSGLSVLS